MKMQRAMFEDVGLLRPWLSEAGIAWVTRKDGRVTPHNPSTSPVGRVMLTKDQWTMVDMAASAGYYSATPLVRTLIEHGCYLNLLSSGLPMTVENSADKTVQSTPLPFTWINFDELDFPTDGREPDLSIVQACGRRVGEAVTKMLVGCWPKDDSPKQPGGYGVRTELYGICNHPNRWTYRAMEDESLPDCASRLISVLDKDKFHGPYLFLNSPDLDFKLDGPWFGERTQRETIGQVGDKDSTVVDVTSCPLLQENTLTCIQLTPDVIRMMVALPLAVIQWENEFRVVTIAVPQIREDIDGRVGIAARS